MRHLVRLVVRHITGVHESRVLMLLSNRLSDSFGQESFPNTHLGLSSDWHLDCWKERLLFHLPGLFQFIQVAFAVQLDSCGCSAQHI